MIADLEPSCSRAARTSRPSSGTSFFSTRLGFDRAREEWGCKEPRRKFAEPAKRLAYSVEKCRQGRFAINVRKTPKAKSVRNQLKLRKSILSQKPPKQFWRKESDVGVIPRDLSRGKRATAWIEKTGKQKLESAGPMCGVGHTRQ